MAELTPVPIGWMTEGGRTLEDQPIQWQIFAGTKEHLIWKIGPVFTVDDGRDGRAEYESLADAVYSLRVRPS